MQTYELKKYKVCAFKIAAGKSFMVEAIDEENAKHKAITMIQEGNIRLESDIAHYVAFAYPLSVEI